MVYKLLNTSTYLKIRLVFVLGIVFCLLGAAGIILSIIELFTGRPNVSHYNISLGGLQVENPLWPSSGKGFWVGLILLVTGFAGTLAACEWTHVSILGFTALSSVSTVLSFYMIMTCIIPVQYDTKYSNTGRPSWQSDEIILNSLLIVVGGLSTILGCFSTLVGCYLTSLCVDQRNEYPYSDDPQRIMVLPSRNLENNVPNA